MKNTTFFFALAVCAVGVSSTQIAQAKTAITKTTTTTTRTTVKTPVARSWVQLKAATDRKVYAPGQSVKVRLTATNTHTRGAFLRFTSGQRYDFSVVNASNNQVVYTWSATRMFMQALGSLWIPAKQSKTFETNIGDEMGELQPGKYRLVAHLINTPNMIYAAPVEFQVSGPSVKVSARTNKTTYAAGEPVEITMTAANQLKSSNTLQFNSGQQFDVFITDEADRPVWNYAANLRFIQVLGSQTWRAGEAKTFTAKWNGVPLPGEFGSTAITPGRYKVQAVLWSNPKINAAPVFINIV